MPSMRILLVEDEPKMAELIRRVLVAERNVVDRAGDAVAALGLATAPEAVPYDVLVLDRMLPDAFVHAESATVHDFDKEKFFEGCLPIEVMAHRGVDTLRFGPMKPVGLTDPKTGRRPHAVVGTAAPAATCDAIQAAHRMPEAIHAQ